MPTDLREESSRVTSSAGTLATDTDGHGLADVETKQIDELVARWQELEKQGVTVSPADLCGKASNLLPALRRRIGLSDDTDIAKWVPPDTGNYAFLNPPQQPDELGRLGDYRVLKALGAGGMGLVFLAEDIKLKRHVALKVVKPSAAGADTARRFLREAQTMAALEHDHIVAVYYVGEDRGVPFMAMQLLRGETLESRLQTSAALPIEQVVCLGRQMAQGLAAAHGRGLIHRDIKPANIWLEAETDRVKLLDFGLARGVQTDVQITSEGALLGTPAYMAPEQARGQSVDGRTDLFSLGCVLYQMCTGKAPFKRDDLLTTLRALELEEPNDPSTLTPNLPAPLAHLILQLLSKDPARRPASVQEVVEALQILERQLTGADGDTARIPTTLLKPGQPKRRNLWPIVAAVVVLGAAAGLTWHFYPTTQAAEPVLAPWIGAPGVRNEFGLKAELIGAHPAENGVHRFLAGDNVAFRLEVDRNAYVGVWTVNLDGDIVQLFPNKHEPDNLVLAGQARVVPGKSYNIVARVDKGIECFRIVASTQPWKEAGGKNAGDFLLFAKDEEKQALMRGFEIVPDAGQGGIAMSEVVLKYLVEPKK